MKLNSIDLFSNLNITHPDATVRGVTYTWNADKTECTAIGTADGVSADNLLNSRDALPNGFEPGGTYYVTCSTTDDNLRLEILFYTNNLTSSSSSNIFISKDTLITLPDDLTGIFFRIRTTNGSTVNATIGNIKFLTAMTNKDLSELADIILNRKFVDVKTLVPDGSDLNDFEGVNEIWLTSTGRTYYNFPPLDSTAGFLIVYSPNNTTLQLLYSYSGNVLYKRKKHPSGTTWEDWQLETGTIVNQIINNYTTEPTYNVSPIITNNTNNFLASTGDTTDVTASIMAMLNSTGICRLGTGVFYVSGVDMPDDSTIIGSGSSTKIILLGSGSDAGYAIKMKSRCTVKNLSILGSTTDYTSNNDTYPAEASEVERHGVIWEGNFSNGNNNIPRRGFLNNCYIANFSGGGITCYESGRNVISGFTITDCTIWHCYAGINIKVNSEFHRITAVTATHCHYGVINNGGNNCFANCNFSKNIVGFMIDNSLEQSPNNSHGSVTNCVFDHSDNNTGVGIHLLGVTNGYIFTGCQLFYSKIVVENCDGVSFIGFNCGKNEGLQITGGRVIMFANCIFSKPPVITVTSNTLVKWLNCYTYDGTIVSA